MFWFYLLFSSAMIILTGYGMYRGGRADEYEKREPEIEHYRSICYRQQEELRQLRDKCLRLTFNQPEDDSA